MGKIAQVPDDVARMHNTVPGVNHCLIHVVDIGKRSAAHADNCPMAPVLVTGEEDVLRAAGHAGSRLRSGRVRGQDTVKRHQPISSATEPGAHWIEYYSNCDGF